MLAHYWLKFLDFVWVLVQFVENRAQVLCLRETFIVLCEVYVRTLCLFCVLVEYWADVVKKAVYIFRWFVRLCSWWCIDHFRLSGILFHLLINHFQQLLNLCPLLIRLENSPNKLPKEPLLNLINNVDISKLTLKRILPIDNFIQYTTKRKTIRLRINIKVSIIV